jgi:hypothetical protein
LVPPYYENKIEHRFRVFAFSSHPGLDPGSRKLEQSWIPAFAGMTTSLILLTQYFQALRVHALRRDLGVWYENIHEPP